MAISKVTYAGNTLIDLTGDTVTPENLLSGATAHAANGEEIAGTMPYRGQYQYTKTAGAGNGYYALNGIPEGCYRAEGQSWAPEIRIAVDDAKKSPMWNDAYNNGRNDSPIHVQYIRSWAAGTSAGEINIRIIVTKNGRQVYDTGNFRPYVTASKEFDC